MHCQLWDWIRDFLNIFRVLKLPRFEPTSWRCDAWQVAPAARDSSCRYRSSSWWAAFQGWPRTRSGWWHWTQPPRCLGTCANFLLWRTLICRWNTFVMNKNNCLNTTFANRMCSFRYLSNYCNLQPFVFSIVRLITKNPDWQTSGWSTIYIFIWSQTNRTETVKDRFLHDFF